MQLNIAGVPLLALVDSGASRTLLHRDTFLQICAASGRSSILQRCESLVTLTGAAMPVLGKTQVSEATVGPIKVVITTSGMHQMLLGDDELRRGNATIDYTTETLTWHGARLHIVRESDIPSDICAVNIQDVIQQTVSSNADVFTQPDGTLGNCPQVKMHIDTGNAKPISQKPYRTPLTKRTVIEEQIASMLKKGVIRPSSSPWASPVTLVPKKDGGTRFCIDYRRVNAVTKKDRYPLPQIQDIFDQIGGASIFSTLDLEAGYWQIPMHEDSIAKTAFTCHMGLFEMLRMPFGCCNCPAVFQRTLNKILSGLIGKICFVYIEDIVIFSHDKNSYAKHLKMVFERLRKNGLRLKPSNTSRLVLGVSGRA